MSDKHNNSISVFVYISILINIIVLALFITFVFGLKKDAFDVDTKKLDRNALICQNSIVSLVQDYDARLNKIVESYPFINLLQQVILNGIDENEKERIISIFRSGNYPFDTVALYLADGKPVFSSPVKTKPVDLESYKKSEAKAFFDKDYDGVYFVKPIRNDRGIEVGYIVASVFKKIFENTSYNLNFVVLPNGVVYYNSSIDINSISRDSLTQYMNKEVGSSETIEVDNNTFTFYSSKVKDIDNFNIGILELNVPIIQKYLKYIILALLGLSFIFLLTTSLIEKNRENKEDENNNADEEDIYDRSEPLENNYANANIVNDEEFNIDDYDNDIEPLDNDSIKFFNRDKKERITRENKVDLPKIDDVEDIEVEENDDNDIPALDDILEDGGERTQEDDTDENIKLDDMSSLDDTLENEDDDNENIKLDDMSSLDDTLEDEDNDTDENIKLDDMSSLDNTLENEDDDNNENIKLDDVSSLDNDIAEDFDEIPNLDDIIDEDKEDDLEELSNMEETPEDIEELNKLDGVDNESDDIPSLDDVLDENNEDNNEEEKKEDEDSNIEDTIDDLEDIPSLDDVLDENNEENNEEEENKEDEDSNIEDTIDDLEDIPSLDDVLDENNEDNNEEENKEDDDSNIEDTIDDLEDIPSLDDVLDENNEDNNEEEKKEDEDSNIKDTIDDLEDIPSLDDVLDENNEDNNEEENKEDEDSNIEDTIDDLEDIPSLDDVLDENNEDNNEEENKEDEDSNIEDTINDLEDIPSLDDVLDENNEDNNEEENKEDEDSNIEDTIDDLEDIPSLDEVLGENNDDNNEENDDNPIENLEDIPDNNISNEENNDNNTDEDELEETIDDSEEKNNNNEEIIKGIDDIIDDEGDILISHGSILEDEIAKKEEEYFSSSDAFNFSLNRDFLLGDYDDEENSNSEDSSLSHSFAEDYDDGEVIKPANEKDSFDTEDLIDKDLYDPEEVPKIPDDYYREAEEKVKENMTAGWKNVLKALKGKKFVNKNMNDMLNWVKEQSGLDILHAAMLTRQEDGSYNITESQNISDSTKNKLNITENEALFKKILAHKKTLYVSDPFSSDSLKTKFDSEDRENISHMIFVPVENDEGGLKSFFIGLSAN
ncbi:AAA family ATPase [Brachyspira pulli]|uniref:AAA family ATPase n=1 Tax=Brachyspira pulli TaxID=310721 RepID=UPI003006BB34